MSNKKIISCFQYPVNTTVFTVSRKSFHTGCSNLTSMFLYVAIFQQMTCFLAAKTSPNMIGLTVKNIIIKKQLKKKFKVPGDLFCTIFEDCLTQCGLAGLLMCPGLSHSMRIGWFTDVPPLPSDGFLFDLLEPCDVRTLSIRKTADLPLQLWVGTFLRFVAMGFYFLSEILI